MTQGTRIGGIRAPTHYGDTQPSWLGVLVRQIYLVSCEGIETCFLRVVKHSSSNGLAVWRQTSKIFADLAGSNPTDSECDSELQIMPKLGRCD